MLLRNKSSLLLFLLCFFVVGSGLCFASAIERRANDTISISLLQKITTIINSRMSGDLGGDNFVERSIAISEMAEEINDAESKEIIDYIDLRLSEIGDKPANVELKVEKAGLEKLREYLTKK